MDYQIINFQQHGDSRGQLIALEESKEVPFKIKRVYYMYDIGLDVRRGYHAHKKLEQILFCVHGECKIHLDNGLGETKEVLLDKPYLPPTISISLSFRLARTSKYNGSPLLPDSFVRSNTAIFFTVFGNTFSKYF